MFKFIVTRELGRLTRWLRILGFDTVYYDEGSLSELIIRTLSEDRIIITRRRKKIGNLEKRTIVVYSNEVKKQIEEVASRLKIIPDESRMFSRCVICNRLLDKVDKEEVKGKVPERIFLTHNDFMRCAECGRIYWQGSHWGNIRNVLDEILD